MAFKLRLNTFERVPVFKNVCPQLRRDFSFILKSAFLEFFCLNRVLIKTFYGVGLGLDEGVSLPKLIPGTLPTLIE